MSTAFVCFFGLIITDRLFSSLHSRFHLEKKVLRAVFCLHLSLDFVFIAMKMSATTTWCIQIIFLLSIFLSPHLIEKQLEKLLKAYTVTFLDQVILSVQAGQSIRNAVRSVIEGGRGWKRAEFLKAYTQLLMAEQPTSLSSQVLQTLFEELRWIDQGRVKTIEQLKSLRWHYKVHQDFRRKTIQVSQQTRIQALIVTFMYGALLSFNVIHFGFLENIKLILLSLAFFVTGTVSIFILGRRLKWTI